MDKVVPSAGEAVADVFDGASIAIGGFGLCGVPSVLIDALLEQGATNLETVSNNCGVDGLGLGVLLAAHRIRRHTGSYVGENPPEGYDIKGNADSMKYHTTASQWYGQTVAEVWFSSTDAAEAAGFVAAVAEKDSDEDSE